MMMNLTRMTKCFSYLDNLRVSGITNMYGARPYLAKAMRLSDDDARIVLHDWLRTFSRDKTAAERAASVVKANETEIAR